MIGAACGAGAPDERCAEGPQALREGGLIFRLRQSGIDADWDTTVRPGSDPDAVAAVSALAERLARRTADTARRGHTPLVLGGDHSCAIGSWKGVAAALAQRGPLGLIWVDAHLDAHTPETTPSGKLHGMPLACLLGHGDPRLTAVAGGIRLDPRHVCVVGARSFEPMEEALLESLGVRLFFMPEVARRGLGAVMSDALALARNASAGYGISIDLDVLDPRDAPGVGSPVAEGIRAFELRRELARLADDAALVALEIAEYNPARDRANVTALAVHSLIDSIAGSGAGRFRVRRGARRAGPSESAATLRLRERPA